jgi:PHO85 cyclin-5
MVLNFGNSQCCLRKVRHTGAFSSIGSASSDSLSISGYQSSTPESQFDHSSTDGRCLSNVSSATSNSLTYDDSNSAAPPTACSDNYRYRPKLESWLAETGLESDQDTPAVVPASQRQHPRRTSQPDVTSTYRQRSPPALKRQEDRTEGFVALLVGTKVSSKSSNSRLTRFTVFTAGLVEAIWPLSACPPKIDTKFYGGGVLPLKTFIQETLRRSKTSYSTLQVALYYLILLKAHLPKIDFTQEQPKGDGCRAMQCGRRMFLAALILASKYLQDRNYSTRAWSKISGLRTVEINQNEVEYLKAIDWNLHVPKEKFDKWSRIVLGLSAQPARDSCGWKNLIAKITPDLSGDFSEYEIGLASPPVSPSTGAYSSGGCNDEKFSSTNDPRTPSNKPWHEPASETPTEDYATHPPPMPRLHNLPTPQTTPQMTPQTPMSDTCVNPAAIAHKSYPRCRASLAAMSSVRNQCLARATLDRCPPPQAQQKCPQASWSAERPQICRRTSPTSSLSSQGSSPASMISDTFTTSTRSRSSSMSSNSSFGLTHSLHLYQKINGSCDFAGPEASSESTVNQLLKVVSPDTACLQVDEEPTKAVIPATNKNLQLNDVSIIHLTSAGGSSEKDMVIDLAPSAYGRRLTVALEPSTRTSRSFTELEAAGVLLALPKGVVRADAAIPRQSSSEATPKATKFKKTDIGPCKSHKRSHSKVNDALQKEVRKQLQSAVAETVEICDANLEYVGNTASKPPIHKASQLPYRSWASVKKPILQGQEYNKRYCATPNEIQAADRAAMYLRRSLESEAVAMYPAAFAAPGLVVGSRDHCVSTSC